MLCFVPPNGPSASLGVYVEGAWPRSRSHLSFFFYHISRVSTAHIGPHHKEGREEASLSRWPRPAINQQPIKQERGQPVWGQDWARVLPAKRQRIHAHAFFLFSIEPFKTRRISFGRTNAPPNSLVSLVQFGLGRIAKPPL